MADPQVRVMVGKIPLGVDEDFLERLLGACVRFLHFTSPGRSLT